MIIAFDANAAVRQGAGIGRYARDLLAAMATHSAQQRFVLFYAARDLDPASPHLQAVRQLCAAHPQLELRPLPIGERQLTIIWQRLRLPLPAERLNGPFDVLHAPDFVLPPTRRPAVMTVHDLTYMVHPETAVPALRRYLEAAVPRSLGRAAAIVAVSHATARDLSRLLGMPATQVDVVHSGVGPQFRPLPAAALAGVRKRLGLPGRFVLHVGTVEPRKNLERLIAAFATLAASHADVELVIAGRRGWMSDPIYAAAASLGQRVRMVDFVADEDLPALLGAASVFAYPSLYEGFGFPPLEAMACGTPVVCSNTSSLPEVVGEAGLLVDPRDTAAIAASIARLLSDPALAADLRQRGLAQAASFNWQRTARAMLNIYARVAQAPGAGHAADPAAPRR